MSCGMLCSNDAAGGSAAAAAGPSRMATATAAHVVGSSSRAIQFMPRAMIRIGTPPRARVQFGPLSAKPAVVEEVKPESKPAKKKREKIKADPKLVAAARELRDRWLEHVNDGQYVI